MAGICLPVLVPYRMAAARKIPVPYIVVDALEVPDHFAGFSIECDEALA